MQSATERRQRILEDLSDKRFITRESLAGKFGVSVRTISRDIELLSCSRLSIPPREKAEVSVPRTDGI